MISHTKNLPLVSIIIPVYNGSDYLAEAIQSALDQTYANCEVLVINDGSTDNGVTRELALTYGDKIRYFEKENAGVASALNFGIKKMKGDYFSWLSHDDKYLQHKVQSQINYIAGNDESNVILFSNYREIDVKSNIIGESKIKISQTEFMQVYIALKRPLINGNTVLIPCSAFDKVGLFDESLRFTQDYDMWFRLSKSFKFLFQEDILIESRIHPNQGSKTMTVFGKDSLELKVRQLQQLDTCLLSKFTNKKHPKSVYFRLFLFSLYNGGEKQQYPIEYYRKLILDTTFFNIDILLYYFLTLLLRSNFHKYIIKTIVLILLLFDDSEFKKMIKND